MHGNLLQTQERRFIPETSQQQQQKYAAFVCRLFSPVSQRCGVPDVLAVLQHRQTDGALLIGVELLVVQAHLQVLGYPLKNKKKTKKHSLLPWFLQRGVCFLGPRAKNALDRPQPDGALVEERKKKNQRETQLLLLTGSTRNDPALVPE